MLRPEPENDPRHSSMPGRDLLRGFRRPVPVLPGATATAAGVTAAGVTAAGGTAPGAGMPAAWGMPLTI
jgi:hypothetical protein